MIHKLTSMFGPNNPHLPTEILLKIFTEEDLVYSDFFRFSCVDKEWHSFTDMNDIRKLMFLPLFESNGEIATLPPLDPVPEARIKRELPFKGDLESGVMGPEDDYRADLWNMRRLHPLLVELHTRQMRHYEPGRWPDRPLHPQFSYQLLKHCASPPFKHPSATWRRMLVAQPPMQRLGLDIDAYDCSQASRWKRFGSHVVMQNAHGVTLGDVVDGIWQTRLPHNVGLVPDDGSCPGQRHGRRLPGSHIKCCCYNATQGLEDAHKQRMMRLESLRKKERFKLNLIEGLAHRKEKETAMRRKEAERED
jgi:hypothetical protein